MTPTVRLGASSENTATLLLSRRTRRHAVLFGLHKLPLIVMGVYIVVAVAASFQSWGVIVLVTIGGVALYAAMRQPLRMDRQPWPRVLDRASWHVDRWRRNQQEQELLAEAGS